MNAFLISFGPGDRSSSCLPNSFLSVCFLDLMWGLCLVAHTSLQEIGGCERLKAVASTLKVVRPGSRCGCSRKWVWSCKEVGVIEERR